MSLLKPDEKVGFQQPVDELMRESFASYLNISVGDPEVAKLLPHLEALRAAGQKVVVHCYGGEGRAGRQARCHNSRPDAGIAPAALSALLPAPGRRIYKLSLRSACAVLAETGVAEPPCCCPLCLVQGACWLHLCARRMG